MGRQGTKASSYTGKEELHTSQELELVHQVPFGRASELEQSRLLSPTKMRKEM